MEAMTERAQQRVSINFSVQNVRKSGQMSAACRSIVRRETGMMIAVRGRAMRLVSMKYCGNVPK